VATQYGNDAVIVDDVRPPKLTHRRLGRLNDVIRRWLGLSKRLVAQPDQDMKWTCPDCSVRHETVIGPDTEAGRIVEVNCRGCGTQHEASVFVRLRRPGSARMVVGIVWL